MNKVTVKQLTEQATFYDAVFKKINLAQPFNSFKRFENLVFLSIVDTSENF